MLEHDEVDRASSTPGNVVLDFDVFFRQEHRRLFHTLVLICGDGSEADDIAQESFVRMLERWDRVGSMEGPTAYLYRTALNEHRSRARAALRWGRRTLFVRDHGDDASAAAIARADVARALETLTPEQRVALVLVEFAGLTAGEAGLALGIEAEAIRSRVHRARTTLREEWADDG